MRQPVAGVQPGQESLRKVLTQVSLWAEPTSGGAGAASSLKVSLRASRPAGGLVADDADVVLEAVGGGLTHEVDVSTLHHSTACRTLANATMAA